MSGDSRVNFHCRYRYVVVFVFVGAGVSIKAIALGHVIEAWVWA